MINIFFDKLLRTSSKVKCVLLCVADCTLNVNVAAN